MSNCSDEEDGTCSRMLAALARDVALMAGDIADMGAALADGADSRNFVIALQSVDYLTQQANAYARLLALLAEGAADDLVPAVAAIPLPPVRRRLMAAAMGEAPAEVQEEGDTVLWPG